MITRGLASFGSVFGARPQTADRPRLEPGRRVYAVGDVHGQLDPLAALHRVIALDLAARPVRRPVLVHLGDLIDRGPDSAGVLTLLQAGPLVPGVPTVNLMGNHEWICLAALARQDDGDVGQWLDNGGTATLASWGIRRVVAPARWAGLVPRAHMLFLRGLAAWYQCGEYVFVHAGVRPGVSMAEQSRTDLLWIREPFLDRRGPLLPDAPGLIVVHGHTPQPEPTVRANRIGIDTGAGRGGTLTCAVLDGSDVRFLQAKSSVDH